MTSIDLSSSIKHSFIILHVFFITGAAFYIKTHQYSYATFFGISSVIALEYYILFQNKATIQRLRAHLNLVEEAIKDSTEFKEKVKKKEEAKEEDEEEQPETDTELLTEKKKEENGEEEQ